MDRDDALARYEAAVREPSGEHLEALAGALADGVVVVGIAGAGSGAAAVLAALADPQRPGLFAASTWTRREPGGTEGGGREELLDVALPPGAPMAGFVFHVRFDDAGAIERVEQQMLAPAAAAAEPLVLTDEIKAAVAGALANGTPLVVAYVDADGAPHLSFRGSTQPHGDAELAIWVREPTGGLLRAIATNPRVALLYRDPATRTSYQFAGRARAEADPQVRATVYERSPEPERNLDARRLGVAVVVELDRVEGTGAGGRFRMERTAGG